MHYNFRRNDVPDVFGNNVDCKKIELPSPVRLARLTGPHAADIAPLRREMHCRFNLHPHQAAAVVDDHVVTRRLSPWLQNPQTELGRLRHKLKLSPLAPTLGILHHLPRIHKTQPQKSAACYGRVSFFSDFESYLTRSVIPSKAKNPNRGQPRRWNHQLCSGEKREKRKKGCTSIIST